MEILCLHLKKLLVMKNKLRVVAFYLEPAGPRMVDKCRYYYRTLSWLLQQLTDEVMCGLAKRTDIEGKIIYRQYSEGYHGVPIGVVRFDKRGRAHLSRKLPVKLETE